MADQKTPSRIIDLDAAREARAVEQAEPVIFRWKGKDRELPPELPALFLDLIGDDEYREALDFLFDEPGWSETFLRTERASMRDLETLAEGIAEHYGQETNLGKSPASGASS